MKQLKGTWRKHFDFRFLSGEDLDKEYTLTIKAVVAEEVRGQRGPEPVTALCFVETEKLMALNKTNAKMISEVAGTPLVENWVGKKITIEPQTVRAFGGNHRCIRVQNKRIKSNPIEKMLDPLPVQSVADLQEIVGNYPTTLIDEAISEMGFISPPNDSDIDGWNRLAVILSKK